MVKSFIGMGCYECPVCLEKHTEVVLIDERMKEQFESTKTIVVGNMLCDLHKQHQRGGYVFLVEIVDATKLRTGRIMSFRKGFFDTVFNKNPPNNKFSLGFITEEAYKKIEDDYYADSTDK